MAIITRTEVKTLLGISTTDYDTLIDTLIPYAEDKVVRHCNNSFVDPAVSIEAQTISFVSGSPATILDSGSGFVTALFSNGMDILVMGSLSNDGRYTASTVAAGVLTLLTGQTVIDEAAGFNVLIYRIKWPASIKHEVAVLIKFMMYQTGKTVKTETLPGGYSVEYKSEAEIMKMFNLYRKPYR